MRFSHFRLALLASCLSATAVLSPACVQAQTVLNQDSKDKPFLHALFSDNAVLQRDRAIPIWGWTTPGKKVTVRLDDKATTATADSKGQWMARIGPYPAGGPHTLSVTGSTPAESATRQDILFGDVWLCSGQSNMEMGIRGANNGPQEVANANFPNIRLFTVPQKTALTPQVGLDSQWLVCTPENILKNSQGGVQGGNLGFSAVGYFFGRKLNQELNVPIGLIQSAWGGTIIEAWISDSALGTVPDFKTGLAARREFNANPGMTTEERVEAWTKKADSNYDSNWANTTGNTTKWKTATVPSFWDVAATPELSNFDGIGLFRREVIVPAAWAGRDLILTLGVIDDFDTSYWNGKAVGSGAGAAASSQRKYTIPGALVKAGRNILAVRVTDTGGPGGMIGPATAMRLTLDATNSLPLDGAWEYQASLPLSKLGALPTIEDPNNPNRIDVLYNGMIAPLEPYALKGAIWYQGESNAARPEQYGRLLPTMIKDWRSRFTANMPFHIVQLAGFMAPDNEPHDEQGPNDWPLLRAAQQRTVDTVPNTTLAVATDIGDGGDIHPRNKQDIGLRLALGALAKDYGKPVEYIGPVLKTASANGAQMVLTFTHTGGGMTIGGDANRVFAVAGADRVWQWATPTIAGDKITLSSEKVPTPKYVRYAWSNLPRGTLYNGDKLPAAPFQTVP